MDLHGERETSAAPGSFDDLFLDQHDRLFRALYFITGSSADAEELHAIASGGSKATHRSLRGFEAFGLMGPIVVR